MQNWHCIMSFQTLTVEADGNGPQTSLSLHHQMKLPTYVSGLLSVPKQKLGQKAMGAPPGMTTAGLASQTSACQL